MLDSFVYQYAVEALVFGVGIWAGIRTGVLAPSTPRGRRRLALLTAGILVVFALQGAFLVWGK
jgi:hypothetical protein